MEQQQQLPPSEQLLQARSKKQWTIEHLAQQLNLPVATLVALEQANYDALHGSGYVIAHMRAYAQILGLDADTLIQQYKALYVEPQSQENNALLQSAFILEQHKKYKTAYGALAALLLLLSLAVLTPDTFKNVSNDKGITIDTSYGSAFIANNSALPEDNPTQDLLPAVQYNAAKTTASTSENHAGQKLSELHFRFTANCWVEVFDGDGQRIYAALQKENQTLALSGKPPFRISLGYAPGVELSYNGSPVSITTSSANATELVVGKS